MDVVLASVELLGSAFLDLRSRALQFRVSGVRQLGTVGTGPEVDLSVSTSGVSYLICHYCTPVSEVLKQPLDFKTP